MNNESLVYLNKVFFDEDVKSCPLITEIALTSENTIQELTYLDNNSNDNGDCDCGCHCSCSCSCNCNCGCHNVSEYSNFNIEKIEVFVNNLVLGKPDSVTPEKVTVDGHPVDSVEYFNQRYSAGTSELLENVSQCQCIANNLPTKAYFLLCGVGPWCAKLSVLIEGTAYGCGTSNPFKLCITTKENVSIYIPGCSSFAIPSICLPCTVDGISPVINFSFGGEGDILNAQLEPDPSGATCPLVLTGNLVVEPTCQVEVTRETLFKTPAEIVDLPCDNLNKCSQCSSYNSVSGVCCQFNGSNGTSGCNGNNGNGNNGCNGCHH